MKKALRDFYLDWFNNFLTITYFAAHYGIEEKDAEILIEMGRKYHEEHVALLKISKQLKDEVHANKNTEG